MFFFFFNDTATTEIYTLSLHDALPISPHPAVVCEASTLPCPLHAHLRVLDQLGRAVVCRTHQQANPPRGSPQCPRTGGRHPRIHRRPQRTPQAFRLGQNRRPNPRQHRSIRATHSRRPIPATYLTNHWDRSLATLNKPRQTSGTRLRKEMSST